MVSGRVVCDVGVGDAIDRLIADEAGRPTKYGRLDAADMRIEEPKRQRVADAGKQHIDTEKHVPGEIVPGHEPGKVAASNRLFDAADKGAEIDEHQRQEECLHRPAERMLADHCRIARRVAGEHECPDRGIDVFRIGLPTIDIGKI